MSLVVWLPLNGNLENQGLSNITVTNNGATVDNNGKIGKCYKCSGDSRISFPSFSWMTMKPQNNFSFFFWVKGTTNGWLFACSAWEFMLRPSFIEIHLAGNGQYPTRYTSTFNTNTWYHLGFTWSGTDGKLLLYLNGSKVAESNIPSSANYDIASTFNLPYDGPRYLNDVRIYDHCLSPKEVKELAKGLVLHYKLAGPGGENQARNTSGVYTNLYSNFNGNINNCLHLARVDTSGLKVGDIIHIHLEYKYDNIVPASGKTASCWIQGFGNVTSWNSGALNPGPNKILLGSGVHIFDYNITITSDHLNNEYWYTNIRHDYIQSGSVQWKNFKVEKGSIATPWCPNPADPLYHTMGYDNNIEYDCAGYHRNGTKSGNITWNVDSPRYITSYKVGLTKAYINTPDIAFERMLQGTLNMWINRHSSTSDWRLYACFANGYNWTSSENDFIIIGSTGGPSIILDCCSNTYSYTPALNEWHMYTITWDLQKHISSFYIDGKLANTVTNTRIDTLYASKHGYHAFGNRISSDINDYSMSDARIYSTILSTEDIAELYHTSAMVDNNGNTYAYEYLEA